MIFGAEKSPPYQIGEPKTARNDTLGAADDAELVRLTEAGGMCTVTGTRPGIFSTSDGWGQSTAIEPTRRLRRDPRKSQFPHKSVNFFCILVLVNDKLTDLWGS